MGKKIKLAALAFLIAVIAYIYPTAKQKYVKHVKPKVELAVNFGKKVANLKVLGKPVPWKFILPVAGVLLVLLYVRRRKKKLQKLKAEEEKRKAELAAQYKALGGAILNPEQDNQPSAPTTPVTPVQPTPTPTVTPVTPVVTSVPTDNENGDIGGRIRTFCEWSSTSTVNIFSLARAGFLYTGRGDVVECFKCKGTLKEWLQDDDPLASHNQYYPSCDFVKKRLAEVDIEKMSCGKRVSDLLAAAISCVNQLKEVQKLCVLGGSAAQKHLADLQKRLDTTERTMHLVMKQMEAVTKCLARTLENDPAGDATEINDGLKVMKESNV
ncbi:uncharacterized protein LOC114523195 [Dendronephthya gigantea]|uniref:uncharacterized protein LOC114523195 n=1 Tax=Dendronephthya gigantea TaxID=151771 RepID=UPI00106C57B4|nr:uncharacterized protein LOC114523195 [Dendronephthya gigantea]